LSIIGTVRNQEEMLWRKLFIINLHQCT
jgi:hypothetical protein